MQNNVTAAAVFAVLLSSAGSAASQPAAGSATDETAISHVPNSAFTLGVGGNVNLAVFGGQQLYAVGTGGAYDAFGTLLGIGIAQGPAAVSMNDQLRIAPLGQVNYWNHLGGGDWLWGAKFGYSYLDSRATTPSVFVPQFGSSVVAGGGALAITGYAYAGSYQTSITHQMVLAPYLGRSFGDGFVYVGGGPSFSQLQTNINNLIGFAFVGGAPANMTGAPTNFSSSRWAVGGAAIAGITYFFTPSLFIDFNYTYSQPRIQANYYFGTFVNPIAPAVSLAGTLNGSSYGHVATHSFVVSLNLAFDLQR